MEPKDENSDSSSSMELTNAVNDLELLISQWLSRYKPDTDKEENQDDKENQPNPNLGNNVSALSVGNESNPNLTLGKDASLFSYEFFDRTPKTSPIFEVPKPRRLERVWNTFEDRPDKYWWEVYFRVTMQDSDVITQHAQSACWKLDADRGSLWTLTFQNYLELDRILENLGITQNRIPDQYWRRLAVRKKKTNTRVGKYEVELVDDSTGFW